MPRVHVQAGTSHSTAHTYRVPALERRTTVIVGLRMVSSECASSTLVEVFDVFFLLFGG